MILDYFFCCWNRNNCCLHEFSSKVLIGNRWCCGVIEFFFQMINTQWQFLQKSDNRGWQFKTKRTMNPSVKVIFKDIEVVKLLCMGNLDHNEGLALGELAISGNIPIMDKVSYCSKIALSELQCLPDEFKDKSDQLFERCFKSDSRWYIRASITSERFTKTFRSFL